MPTTVELIFKDNTSITWEYLDNPFTRKHLAAIKECVFKRCQWEDSWYGLPQMYYQEWNSEQVEYYSNQIRECIRQINKYVDPLAKKQITYPIPIKLVFFEKDNHLKNQKLLNELHRYFTTFSMSMGDVFSTQLNSFNGNDIQLSWHYTIYQLRQNLTEHAYNVISDSEGFDPSLVFNIASEDIDALRTTVEKTNELVHEIEKYILTPNKLQMKSECYYNEFNVVFAPTKAYYILPSDRKFMTHDNSVADVWCVQTQILGKNYPVAYTDHDDPNMGDIWEGPQFTGSFSIGDRSYLDWPPFKNWLKENNIHGSPAGFPLGKIIKGKEYLNQKNWIDGIIKSILVHETTNNVEKEKEKEIEIAEFEKERRQELKDRLKKLKENDPFIYKE